VKGEKERGEGRESEGKLKGRKVETRWREGFGPSKNFGVAGLAPLCQTPSWF